MAEPVSALPNSPPNSTIKTQSVPGPKIVKPLPELPKTPVASSEAEKLVVRYRTNLEHSYHKVSGAILNTWDRSRRKFHYLSQERPLHLLLGVAVAAFITGAALRIWRSNHD